MRQVPYYIITTNERVAHHLAPLNSVPFHEVHKSFIPYQKLRVKEA